MKFIIRHQLAAAFFFLGISHALVIGGFLIWTQKLKFVNFGAYVVLGGEDGGLVVIGMIFCMVDIVLAGIGAWFMSHAEIT